jgi:predicted nucleic-acid-binding protein
MLGIDTNVLVRYLVRDAIGNLLETTDLDFEDEPAIEAALFVWKDNPAELSDCLIGARNLRLGCRATATFDERAAKLPEFVAV